MDTVTLGFAFLAWVLASAAAGVLAWAGGGDFRLLGAATALALSPGLAGLILLPWLGARLPALLLLAIWLLGAAGLVAGGGGVVSPLVAVFAIAAPLASALGRPWAAYAGAAALLSYAGACALALQETQPTVLLGAFPEILSVEALAFAAALVALERRAAIARPAREQTSRRIAEVSHELRTPLTHILGFAELIETQIFGPIEARYVEYAGLIRRSGAQLLELVNDHLDISRIDAGKYELDLVRFDARAIVEEAVRMASDAASRKNIALAAWTPDAPLNVYADERALRRMVTNTLGNALKFTPAGGRVVVAARAVGEMLVLETIDNGPGIPSDERARLGQAFERGASGDGAEGTGLGLSLVRAMAALHGGTLGFHDAPGGGALVRIELPVLALS